MAETLFSENVVSRDVRTDRFETRLLESGEGDGTPVLFVHGNLSSAVWWDEILAGLPDSIRAMAPDLRGYGEAEARPVDATRGLRDFSDDVHALVGTELDAGESFHLVGWSNGGGVAMQYLVDHPERLDSLTLLNPLSPYGFGGTLDVDGTPCWDDYAGSGGGTVNDELVERLEDGDRSAESEVSPRNVMLGTYFAPDAAPDLSEKREETYLTSMLRTAIGEENYPGDALASENWPNAAPGTRGVNNAVSPKYCDLSSIADVAPKPPILWIRGDEDLIVSNTSMFDPGYLGKIGEIPGWPGEEVFPPQPMIDQTRAVLDEYGENDGTYVERVFEGAGHAAHVERPDAFVETLLDHVLP